MTENIAIYCLKAASELNTEMCEECPLYGQTGADHCCEDALQVAIKALEEVQQYRTIGTVEECRAAMEKQTAKKMESPWCPCCGKFLTTEYMNKRYHCIYCGQLLEWGDEE